MLDTTTGAISTDTPCRTCGYNLRGLQVTDNCPECATPLGFSLRPDRLQFANPKWLRKIVNGLLIFLINLFVTAAILLTPMFFGTTAPIFRLAEFGRIVLTLTTAAGVWFMTTPDPGEASESVENRARRIARVCIIIGLIVRAVGFTVDFTPAAPLLSRPFAFAVQFARLIEVVGIFALVRYFEYLATRIPDNKVTQNGAAIRWGMLLSWTYVCSASLVHILSGGGTPTGFFVRSSRFAIIDNAAISLLAIVAFAFFFLILGMHSAVLREETKARHNRGIAD